jgi:sporulation protein YlmC with PRC-barrel domain
VLSSFALLFAAQGIAQDINTAGTKDQPDKHVTATPVYRSKTIVGMKVKNPLGEDVGKISELVLDAEKGTIQYAALSVGGFLGVGGKMYAVPWKSLVLNHGEKDTFFVLDVDKDKLASAPGFDEKHWPDVANPKFGEQIDKYFGVNRTSSETKTGTKSSQTEKQKAEAKQAEAKQKEQEKQQEQAAEKQKAAEQKSEEAKANKI